MTGSPVEKGHYERSDISVVPATGVVAEAMVCLTLADMALDKFGGDSMAETLDNAARYRARAAGAGSGSALAVGGTASGGTAAAGEARTTHSGAFAPAESE